MKCFYRLLGEINKTNIQILDLSPEELDHLLGKLFKDVRKIDSEEYKPSTLTGVKITAPPPVVVATKCQVSSNHTASRVSNTRGILSL